MGSFGAAANRNRCESDTWSLSADTSTLIGVGRRIGGEIDVFIVLPGEEDNLSVDDELLLWSFSLFFAFLALRLSIIDSTSVGMLIMKDTREHAAPAHDT